MLVALGVAAARRGRSREQVDARLSRMPARIRDATYSCERVSTTTDSIPPGEQVGQQQAGRAGTDDRDLSPHGPILGYAGQDRSPAS